MDIRLDQVDMQPADVDVCPPLKQIGGRDQRVDCGQTVIRPRLNRRAPLHQMRCGFRIGNHRAIRKRRRARHMVQMPMAKDHGEPRDAHPR